MRLLIDPPAGGAWNMALDDALLGAAAGGDAALRFYSWSAPTLSLGYFQRALDRRRHAASAAAPCVRRRSGGGAIVHDDELTYSLALPGEHRLSGDAESLYLAVHRSLVAALAHCGVSCELWAGGEPIGREQFLCFRRRSSGDVVCGQDKIAGSAQRRRRAAVLLHGGILLAASPAAPELPGVFELTGRRLAPDELIDAWRPGWETLLQEPLEQDAVSDAERAAAQRIEESVFANDEWTLRR